MFTFYLWLSMRGNSFLVCSACDEIGPRSACDKIVAEYAQHTHAIIFEMTQKSLIKMQISPIKYQNFEKPSRNLSNRTKVKILKKNNFLDISQKKFGSAYAQSPRKSSNIEILVKINGKEAKFFRKFTKGI
jgi:hypothetical protein